MEYRKLISFGKNSFVISLPKPWIRQHKLVKGDLIYVEETGPNLMLSKKEFNKGSGEKEKVILVDGKSRDWIERVVCSTYINNYNKIIFKGKELRGKVKELQSVIQNLIALEIMEQTTDTIVAKVFLDMETVSVNELVRKMDIVTRTMLKEACEIFKDDNYESLNERDKDVNRLYFLHSRAVLFYLDNPMKAVKSHKLNPSALLRAHKIAFYVEAVADEARRIARYAREEISAAKKKKIEDFLLEILNYYTTTIKAAHTSDENLALEQADCKEIFYKKLKDWEEDSKKTPDVYKLMNRMQRIVSLIHNLGRVIYTF